MAHDAVYKVKWQKWTVQHVLTKLAVEQCIYIRKIPFQTHFIVYRIPRIFSSFQVFFSIIYLSHYINFL